MTDAALPQSRSRFRIPRFWSSSMQLNIGLVMFTIIIVALIIQGLFIPASYLDGVLTSRLKPPGWGGHVLGTDQLGRDLLFRVMGGLPWSLGIAGVATMIIAVVGTLVGLIGAWYENFARTLVLLAISTFIAFPFLVLALVMVSIVGRGYWPITLTLGVIGWPSVARVLYAEGRGLLTREYGLLINIGSYASSLGQMFSSDITSSILLIVAIIAALVSGFIFLSGEYRRDNQEICGDCAIGVPQWISVMMGSVVVLLCIFGLDIL